MNAVAPAPEPIRGRPLYVLGSRHCAIDLDGPALLVRGAGVAAARYPLVRISRIVSGAHASWHSRALSACLGRHIPVIFLDRDGGPAGYLQPSAHSKSSLDEALGELLTRPDWPEHYSNWLRAERMRLVREWLKAREARGQRTERRELREAIRTHVYRVAHSASPDVTGGIIDAALLALACEQLRNAGVAHRYFGFGGIELDLAADLHRLLGCALDLETQGLGATLEAGGDVLLRIVQVYATTLTERSRGILGRLHRRAMELVHQWH